MKSMASTFKFFVSLGIIGLLYALFSTYYDFVNHSWYGEVDEPAPEMSRYDESSLSNTTKKILFWTTMFGFKTFYMGDGDFFRDCTGIAKHCFATYERSFANIEDFDAILFHGWNFKKNDVPSTRSEQQNYVFVNLESPLSLPLSYQPFDNNYFNLSMTYRLDSDVVWPYGHVRNINGGKVVAPKLETEWNKNPNTSASDGEKKSWRESEIVKRRSKKTKAAAWIVSNCKPRNGRDKYVEELARYIDIDIYGKCGNKRGCPKKRDCFHETIEPDYYFYLSFENSMCQDYVTEKLYEPLRYDVVPIVYGGANYSLFAPPKSYINALDFDSPEQLAIHLKKLISEPAEYEKYFEWKKSYEITRSNNIVICRLCQYLHENHQPKTYSKLSAWYVNDRCPLQRKIKPMSYLTKKDLDNRG